VLVDIVARYLMLLGTTTRDIAESAGRLHAELDDVRLALEHVGAVRPVNIFDDPEDADTRGIDQLVEWFKGPQAAELRRVAGFAGENTDAGVKNEEWVAGELGVFPVGRGGSAG
jgi:transcription initiation factor TFIID subunit 3